MGVYHALIKPTSQNGIHERASVEALNLREAKLLLEVQFGKGRVASLWGEWESSRLR
jgi:hypothetical protein